MTSVCQGLSSFAPEGGKMKDPGNEVGDFQESCSKVMQNQLVFVSQIKPSNKTLDWCFILIFFDPFWLIIPHF